MKTPARQIRLNSGWRPWVAALVGTLALNLLLFSTIPNLMKPHETIPQLGSMIQQIQLTRLRRARIDPEKEKEPPVAKAQPKKQLIQPKMNRQMSRPLSLPFEVNPRLPQTGATLALPKVMSQSLDNLSLTTVFNPGDLDRPLTVLSRVPPVYPFRAKARAIEGWVSVEFTVNELGRVEDIKILEAEPKDTFEESVIQCLASWRFQPGRINAELVKTRAMTRIRFQLN